MVRERRVEIITLYGETDGASATGTFALSSPLFTGTVTAIKLDKGLKARLWVRSISGAPTTVKIEYSPDGGTTWQTLAVAASESAATLLLDPRKPVEVVFATGQELLRAGWEQATPAKASVEIVMEIVEVA